MAGVHSYDVTLRDEKYSLRQGRGPSYLEIWRRSAKEQPVKEGKPLNMSTKRRNAQKGKSVQFPTLEICMLVRSNGSIGHCSWLFQHSYCNFPYATMLGWQNKSYYAFMYCKLGNYVVFFRLDAGTMPMSTIIHPPPLQ